MACAREDAAYYIFLFDLCLQSIGEPLSRGALVRELCLTRFITEASD